MTKKLRVTLSDEEYRQLKLWAAWHGKNPAPYAAQILAARIEANIDTIKKLVESAAKSRGMTPAEIEAEWLGNQIDEDSE